MRNYFCLSYSELTWGQNELIMVNIIDLGIPFFRLWKYCKQMQIT